MKSMNRLVVPTCFVVLVVVSMCGLCHAQGCGQISIDEGDITCCDGTEQQQDRSCGGSGNPSYFCSEGSGDCCGTSYSTTNLTYDPEECGPPPSCCTGGVTCGYRQFCLNEATGCECGYASPIIVDTTGQGFHLTTAANGVMFDIAGDGSPIQLAWTAADSGNAFLALDRNNNGKIDSGRELFGNFTEQPESPDRNGYLALQEFDKPANGGNGDGIIDSWDAVYSKLLLWIDANHDGISQPNELHTLPQLGVFSISLRYHAEPFTDQYGNWFHYRAALNPDPQDGRSADGRWTYDVFFVNGETKQGVAHPRVNLFRGSNCADKRNFRLLLDDPLGTQWSVSDRSVNPPTDRQQISGGAK